MEKSQARSFENIHGAPKLPIGYRFRPTDEELVVHYLTKKALSLPLPASIIPEIDVLQNDPNSLPGDVREKRYFFYKKKKDENVKRFGVCGYWKPVGKGRVIMASDNPNQTVGIRRTMAFCQRNSNTKKTRWLLHEYHLARSGPTPNSLHLISPIEGNEYWVVCGVLQKKRRPGNRKEKKKKISLVVTNDNKPCSFDVIVEDLSDSSIITDDDDDNIE